MEDFKGSLVKYKINEKNSVRGESPSRDYPGHGAELALDITSIAIEHKTSVIKQFKVGQEIEFLINEDVTIFVPNYRNKEDDEIDYAAEGSGSGTITEISQIDESLEDDEYQEVIITLKNGYAEGL